MKHYNSIKDLVLAWKELPVPGGIYMQKSKADKISNSEYWVISNNETKDQELIELDNGELAPEELMKYKVKSFLETSIFQDIIKNKLKHNSKLKLSQTEIFVDAINYYLEKDTFLD